MKAAKRECRQLERCYRSTGLTVHHEIYIAKRNEVHTVREQAKVQYFNKKIESIQNQKDLFKLITSISGSSPTCSLPKSDDSTTLANKFADYFVTKIDNIRSSIASQRSQPDQGHSAPEVQHVLTSYTPVSDSDTLKLLNNMKPKSCSMDPIPTWLVKDCKQNLVPILTSIINISLSSGVFPSQLKQATITPILKKTNLDQECLKNFRPVSNIPFLSKLMEKEVCRQFVAHLETTDINTKFQSAYKAKHSTETTLTRVQNDLLRAVDGKGGAILVLLDLSAAFDTIDHELLLEMLDVQMGVRGTALSWFRSYLTGRKQRVVVGGKASEDQDLRYGVPQGSVLGPVLFTTYTQPLHNILSGIDFQLYADDSQLYLAFEPRSVISTNSAITTLEECYVSVKTWMNSHFLKLNDAKTEVLVITAPAMVKHLQPITLKLGETSVVPNQQVRDLGVTWDSTMRLDKHITNVCKSAYHQLHNIYRIRKYLTDKATKSLVHAFITSRLDYCNGLLYGTPKHLLDRLQRVQNTAARLITGTARSSHITPILCELHWLPVSHRINYKIALLTFKALHDLAPVYLKELLTPYAPTRSLRSARKNLLEVPAYHLKAYGGRSFECMAPVIWNQLPDELRTASELSAFKRDLKTFLFKDAYKL
jgi:hypothetical protein